MTEDDRIRIVQLEETVLSLLTTVQIQRDRMDGLQDQLNQLAGDIGDVVDLVRLLSVEDEKPTPELTLGHQIRALLKDDGNEETK